MMGCINVKDHSPSHIETTPSLSVTQLWTCMYYEVCEISFDKVSCFFCYRDFKK
jgi:hypothetical protein